MTEPIDHAAEARNLLEFIGKNALTDSQALVSIGVAQVHAVMASVAAQDRANELKRIEILVALSGGETHLADDAYAALVVRRPPADGKGWLLVGFAPSVAASLGLGGESDGE